MPYHVTAEVLAEGTRVTIERSTAEQSMGFLYASGPLMLLGILFVILSQFGVGPSIDAGIIFLAFSSAMLAAAYLTTHFDSKKELKRCDQIVGAFTNELVSAKDGRASLDPSIDVVDPRPIHDRDDPLFDERARGRQRTRS